MKIMKIHHFVDEYDIIEHDYASMTTRQKVKLFQESCKNGQTDIVEKLIEILTPNISNGYNERLSYNNFKQGFEDACLNGHVDIIILIFKHWSNLRYDSQAYNKGLVYAINGGQYRMAEFMLDHGAKYDDIPFNKPKMTYTDLKALSKKYQVRFEALICKHYLRAYLQDYIIQIQETGILPDAVVLHCFSYALFSERNNPLYDANRNYITEVYARQYQKQNYRMNFNHPIDDLIWTLQRNVTTIPGTAYNDWFNWSQNR
jgi:hypothetical protein